MKPDTDAMQEVAKSTNDWYKERKINNQFNPSNLENGNNQLFFLLPTVLIMDIYWIKYFFDLHILHVIISSIYV